MFSQKFRGIHGDLWACLKITRPSFPQVLDISIKYPQVPWTFLKFFWLLSKMLELLESAWRFLEADSTTLKLSKLQILYYYPTSPKTLGICVSFLVSSIKFLNICGPLWSSLIYPKFLVIFLRMLKFLELCTSLLLSEMYYFWNFIKFLDVFLSLMKLPQNTRNLSETLRTSLKLPHFFSDIHGTSLNISKQLQSSRKFP